MKELDSFTVERLEKWISAGEAAKGHHDGVRVSGECLTALSRIALAAKRAEPIYQYQSGVCNDQFDGIEWVWDDCDNGFYNQYDPARRRIVYTTPQLNSPEIPEGWPTEDMVIAGFESGAWDALSSAVLKRQGWPYSCRESAECVTGIFKAMLAAAPEKTL